MSETTYFAKGEEWRFPPPWRIHTSSELDENGKEED